MEARQSFSESTEWRCYKPPKHSSMKMKEKMRVTNIKKETRLITGEQFPKS